MLVAGDADGRENLLPLFGVAVHGGGSHVFFDDGGAVAAGFAKEFLREFGHLTFATLIAPAFFDIDPGGGELALLHALEEFKCGGWVRGENGSQIAFQSRTGFRQQFIDERRGAGGGEFPQQGHSGGGEFGGLVAGEQVFHHRLDGSPFPRRKQRQHGEALIEWRFGVGDDGVYLRLQRSDFIGGIFVTFRQTGKALEQCWLPPEELAGLFLQKGERSLHIVSFSISKCARGEAAHGVAAVFGEGAEETFAEKTEDVPHLLAGD